MLKLNVLLICIEGFFLLRINKSENKRKLFFILTCTQAILLSGLRHIHVGMDTYNYWQLFERVKNFSWGQLWECFRTGTSPYAEVETGFFITMKFFQLFSDNFRVYLVAFAAFVNIPIFVLFYRKAKDGLICVLIYMCLYFAFVSTTGLRQTMAMIVMCIIGYDFIEKRKLIPFLILVGISYTFHRTALAFIPFYFLAYKKPSPKYFLVCLGAMVILFAFRMQFANLLSTIGGYEEYTDQYEGAGTWNFSTIMIIMMLISMWRYKNVLETDSKSVIYLNATIFSCMMLPLTFVDPSMLRLVFYYSMYSMFLIEDLPYAFKKKDTETISWLIIAVLLIMYLRGMHIYKFMWETGIYSNIISPV